MRLVSLLTFVVMFFMTGCMPSNNVGFQKVTEKYLKVDVDLRSSKSDICVYKTFKSLFNEIKEMPRSIKNNLKIRVKDKIKKIIIHPTRIIGMSYGEVGEVLVVSQRGTFINGFGNYIDESIESKQILFDSRGISKKITTRFELQDGVLQVYPEMVKQKYKQTKWIIYKNIVTVNKKSKDNKDIFEEKLNIDWHDQLIKIVDYDTANRFSHKKSYEVVTRNICAPALSFNDLNLLSK